MMQLLLAERQQKHPESANARAIRLLVMARLTCPRAYAWGFDQYSVRGTAHVSTRTKTGVAKSSESDHSALRFAELVGGRRRWAGILAVRVSTRRILTRQQLVEPDRFCD
jgi:hypothetical protein